MKIMHYFLGFPPYRSGGLTKYAFDLMSAQVEDGNAVTALWPGEIKRLGDKPYIKKKEDINNIENYELINPLPIPLDEGIKEVESFKRPCDSNIYRHYLGKIRPDVIHIHTLMGLHKEFVDVACELRIYMVFTSHDYFGLCPKVTFYRYGYCCDDDKNCENCIQCNLSALSLKKIQLMQSALYRKMKNNAIIKKIRRRHRLDFFGSEILPDMPHVDIEQLSRDYRDLRAYYVHMYEEIDCIHFTSTIAENIFKRYVNPQNSQVISITHKGIEDNRNIYKVESTKLRILYLAPAKPYKGFDILKEALDELWREGEDDFELKIFSPVRNPSPYMVIKEEGYDYSELENIFSNADVLIAPSVWYETFGFTVLEAISYGVPVIVSNNIGAKDIIGGAGIIVKTGSPKELKESIRTIYENKRKAYKMKISNDNIKLWKDFVWENYQLYGRIME